MKDRRKTIILTNPLPGELAEDANLYIELRRISAELRGLPKPFVIQSTPFKESPQNSVIYADHALRFAIEDPIEFLGFIYRCLESNTDVVVEDFLSLRVREDADLFSAGLVLFGAVSRLPKILHVAHKPSRRKFRRIA